VFTLTACANNGEKVNSSKQEQQVSSGKKEIKSGTYEADGTGFGGTMNVKVTVKDGKIDDVEVVKNFETAGVGKVALGIVADRIVEGQSTDVDAVTGATISSSGLMSTVR
jgi:uncharacterized protein with FMN-binding domain